MPLTPEERRRLFAEFAVGEEEERRLSDFIAGATAPPATDVLCETDARSGRRGAVFCVIAVDRDEDPALAELFDLRAELTEREFLDRWDVRPGWSAFTRPGCAEALVRLDLIVRSPRPSLHRFLLRARANAPALTVACHGHPTFLVPRELVGRTDLRPVLLASLLVSWLPENYDGALAIALADVGVPGIEPPSPSARRACFRSGL